MSGHSPKSVQKITLSRIAKEGWILDIGAGGEGLVSRIEKERVCAVDMRMSEIREAQIHGPPANWIVADGQQLCFQNEIFSVVTMWFSLGYMREWSIKQKILAEAHRVLRRNGIISILASNIPESGNQHIFWGRFVLPDGTVSQTGYGVRGGQNQTLEKIIEILKQGGFSIQSSKNNDAWFEIQACKTE